jgi:hypothetical protein
MYQVQKFLNAGAVLWKEKTDCQKLRDNVVKGQREHG